jgi:DNA-binding transcriptional ArsR family regulator
MVEYTIQLDSIFASLADPTRRDILTRLKAKTMTVGEIAAKYDLTFAAISKHLKVLEKANLVTKERKGKEQMVHLSPQALAEADSYLEQYRQMWEQRFSKLDELLKED